MKKIYGLIVLPLLLWLLSCNFSVAQKMEGEKTWLVKCIRDECMPVSLKIFKGQRISQIRLYGVGDREIMEFLLPLGFSIKERVFLKIDNNPALPTRIVACEEKGCTGFLATSRRIIRDMMKGRNISLIFTKFSDSEQYTLDYSLMGFTSRAYREAKGKYG